MRNRRRNTAGGFLVASLACPAQSAPFLYSLYLHGCMVQFYCEISENHALGRGESQMSVAAETIKKLDHLPDEQMQVVVNLVDYFLKTPAEIFDELCEEGLKNPMTDDEIDTFVSEIRKERYERSHCN